MGAAHGSKLLATLVPEATSALDFVFFMSVTCRLYISYFKNRKAHVSVLDLHEI